jgi:hypothetical protein
MKLLERTPNIDSWSTEGEKIENVKGHIKFSNVYFRYSTRPNVPVLRGLYLEIKPGQFAVLVQLYMGPETTSLNDLKHPKHPKPKLFLKYPKLILIVPEIIFGVFWIP